MELRWHAHSPVQHPVRNLEHQLQYQLPQEILSQAPSIELLSPEWLREEIAGNVIVMWEKYQRHK